MYKIGDFYICETEKKSLTTRVKRAQGSLQIEWDDVEVLDKAKDLQERKVKESVRVHQTSSKGIEDEQR